MFSILAAALASAGPIQWQPAEATNQPPAVVLTTLPGARFIAGEISTWRAEVFDPDSRVAQVEFHLVIRPPFDPSEPITFPLGVDMDWPFQITWTNWGTGWPMSMTARATDEHEAHGDSLPVWFVVCPANDDFARRVTLTGSVARVEGVFPNATFEPGESSLLSGAGSVWWSWTASANGSVTLDAQGGLAGVVVYTGDSITALKPVAHGHGRIVFEALAGTTYQLALETHPETFEPATLSLFASRPPLVTLLSPTNGAEFISGATLVLHAEASDDGAIARVEFYSDLDSLPVGAVTNGPFTLPMTLPTLAYPTDVHIWAVATDDQGLTTHSEAVLVQVRPVPPVNDLFLNRIVLPGSSLTVTGTVAWATQEMGEPAHGEESVWWSWTAPASDAMTLTTDGEWSPEALWVYVGSSVSNLVCITNSNGSSSYDFWFHESGGPRLVFQAVAGTEYQIAAVGWNRGGVGNFALHFITSAPPSVTISNPTPGTYYLTGAEVPFVVAAEDSDGEVERVEFYQNGQLVAVTTNRPFETTLLLTNDLGVTYSYRLDARATDNSGLTRRAAEIYVAARGIPPANDLFQDRVPLAGSFLTVTGTTLNAWSDPGEWGRFVWWSWTAPASGPVTLELTSLNGDASLWIMTGSSISNLTHVTDPGLTSWEYPAQVTFQAVAGQAYQIGVNPLGTGGPVFLTIAQSRPPSVQLISPPAGAHVVSGTPITLQAGAVDSDGTIQQVEFVVEGIGRLAGVFSGGWYTATVTLTNEIQDFGQYYRIQARATDNHGLLGYSEVDRGVIVDVVRPANDLFANRVAVIGAFVSVTGSTVYATRELGETAPGWYSIWWSWTAPESGAVTLDLQAGVPHSLAVLTGSSVSNLALVAATNVTAWPYSARLVFEAVAGTAYSIAVDTLSNQGGRVAWQLVRSAPPTVAITTPADHARFFTGASVLVYASTADGDGTVDRVEFYLDSNRIGTATNAPFQVAFTVDDPYDATHFLEAWAADNHGLVTRSERVAIRVTPSPPPNDPFANRLPLTGFLAVAAGSSDYATREPGEPDPFGQPDRGSIWWTWKAPASGLATLQCEASSARLSVWTGSAVADLTLVGTNALWFPWVSFPAAAGATYQIAIEDGPGRMSLFLDAPQPALMSTAGRTVSGEFQFQFTTLAERVWVVQASTDLDHWDSLGTNTSRAHVFPFIDPDAALFRHRFYRVVAAP